MKIALVIALAVLSTGCASRWEAYSAQHECRATGLSAQKTQVEISSQTTLSTMGAVATPVPGIRFQRVFQYQCDNGEIWAYSPPPRATVRANPIAFR